MAYLRNSTVNGLNLCSNALLNTAFGSGSLRDNTTNCGCNTGIGAAALLYNTTGIKNTAIGSDSLFGGNGSYRTGLGSSARGCDAYTTSIGSNVGGVYSGCHTSNIAIGSAQSGRIAYANSITVGYCAGYFPGTAKIAIGHLTRSGGNCSIVIGSRAGYQNGSVGNCSIVIGYKAGYSIGGAENNILVGYNATQQNGYGCNDQTVLGNAYNNVYNCVYGAWDDVSDCRDKTNVQPLNNLGLNFLRKLNPVKYKWDLRQKYTNECGYEYGIKDGTLKQDQTEYGFLAQEIEFAAKSLGENFDAVTHDTFIDQYSLNYLNLLASLTKALQEINNDLDLIETQLNS
jgi:hypothetical protein